MDENSSSDNTSPSYYVYQQQQQPGKRSSRSSHHHHHSRGAPAYNSSGISGPPPAAPFGYGQPMTSRHSGQMPYPPSQQDMGGSYYDGGAMPFVGADSAAAMSAGIPAAASQIFQSGGSNYQYDSSNVCGGPNDMPAYGSAAAISQSAAMSSDMYGARRRGKFRRQAIRLPDAPPLKQQCRRRLPTPEPDILERVYIRRIPCKIIEEIIEEPMTPPPRVVEKFINQPPKQNRYVRRIVKVPPRSGFGMYGAGGSTMTGGYGAYGAGYTPGHGIGGVGGSSYGYMDKSYNMGEGTSSTYDGASYASMQQQQPAPSMDYEAARGIPGYGMQVGSNVMHSSFANMPSASLSGASAGYQGNGGMGSSFSSGGNYDCYPISGGGGQFQSQNYYGGAAATEAPPPPIMMPPAAGGPSGGMMPNYYQPSQRYFPPQSSQPPTGISNLGYYSGAPPNLICSLRGSGTPGCPFNLCCYPASAPPMPFSAGGPSVGSGGYPTTTGGGSQALGGAFDYAPMPIPSGPVYGGNAPQFDYGSSRAPAYMPSSTANVQFPPANFGQSIGGRFDGNLPGGATGLTAYPTYGGGNLNMYSGGGSAGFGGSSVDYGSGMGMYGGSSGMFGGQPHSSGSSSFGNFSGYAGSSQPSFQDFSQYGGGSYGGGGTMMGGVNPAAYGCPPNECGGRVFRQIIAMPEPPAEPIFCRQRLPTPPPDIYERILVCRPPRKVMYNIVEQPTCPPPIVRNQYVMANPQPPSVMNQCVQVPPKSYQSQAINMGSSGLGAYGGQCYGGGMMSNSVCMPMGSNCCGMMPMGGSGCMSCTCMPCQVFGLGDDYYSGGYPGYDYGGGYPGIGGGGYPGIGGGYPGIGGGYPGIGGGYPGIGGGYPGIGGGYPGIGGGYPGIGGGYPGFGGGYPGFGGGGYPGYGGGGYPGMVGYPGTGGYPGYDGGYGGLGGYGGGYGGYGGGGGY